MSLSSDGQEVSLMPHISELNRIGVLVYRQDLQEYLKGFVSGGGRICQRDKSITADVFQKLGNKS